MKTFTAAFGFAQTSLGYQFKAADGSSVGARVTTGIAVTSGFTYIITVTVPIGAVVIEWDSAEAKASELITIEQVDSYPTVGEIISAAGGISAGAAAALEAADQVILTSVYVPTASPSVIIPVSGDPDLVTVFLNTEDIVGSPVSGAVIKIKPRATAHSPHPFISASGKVVSGESRQMSETNNAGVYIISLERGLSYSATCLLFFPQSGKNFMLGTLDATYDLAAL